MNFDGARGALERMASDLRGLPLERGLDEFERFAQQRLVPADPLEIVDDMLLFEAHTDGSRCIVAFTRQVMLEIAGEQHDTLALSLLFEYPPHSAESTQVWGRPEDAPRFTSRVRASEGFERLRQVPAQNVEPYAEPL